MAVENPQVRLRGLASSRFEKPPRFRESLVPMPAAQKKISSWNQAGLTGSRITLAGLGLACPAGGPGVLPGPPAGRKPPSPLASPRCSPENFLTAIWSTRRTAREIRFPSVPIDFTSRGTLLLSSHFQGFGTAKVGMPRFSSQEDLRYKSFNRYTC